MMALIECSFSSQALNIAVSMNVILPQAACLSGSKVPVLYLLHGLSDDHTIWQRRTSIERYVEPLGLAVVMPAVSRSYYTDMAHGARYWTFVSQELPRLSQALFPISAERSDSFVAGLSMGGYGALKLALSLPNRFAAAASLSGALDVVRHTETEGADLAEYRDRFGDITKLRGSDNDLCALAAQAAQARRQPRLYQCCGTEDSLYADNLAFRDEARRLGLDLTYEEGAGQHDWAYWDRQIQRVLEWLPLPSRGS
jgi:putative tributyrin esterase